MIIALATHLYLAPRRIRVRNAFSEAVVPRRSVVAGCTWATVLIRLIVIPPAERLLQQVRDSFKQWELRCHLMIYVDDVLAVTSGVRSNVAVMHAWLTRLILQWINKALLKKVSLQKSQVVASNALLRDELKAQLGDLSSFVAAEGELLGMDFAGGAPLRLRPVTRKRLRKAMRRRRRLKWWRNLGGAAHEVARGGLITSIAHGSPAHGIPTSILRDMRRIQAASSTIKASGSSTTAKLAVGGHNYADVDPAVALANPPLLMLAASLWDDPTSRADHVVAWRLAKREVECAAPSRVWRLVRGPVGAALAHLQRLDAAWRKPFVVTLLEVDIDLLEVPPKVVGRVLKEHARRHYDRLLIANWAAQYQWSLPDVMRRYSNGVDWNMLRSVLRGKKGGLAQLERHALHVLVTGATLPEEWRWKEAGMRPTGSCLSCLQDVGSAWHKSNDCGSVEQDITWMRARGRRIRRPRDEIDMMPLATLGIPPLTHLHRPREIALREGTLVRGTSGCLFGDASGVGWPQQAPEVVTWSVITLARDGESLSQSSSGTCRGWYPSVARGELQALVEMLEAALIPATYVGDCQYVVDGFEAGVPRSFTSSESVHADLWRRARWLVNDHGPGIDVIKIKAHRSKTRAEHEDGTGGLELWHGNKFADATAKGLALRLWEGSAAEAGARQSAQEDYLGSVIRAAICTRLAQSQMDGLKLPKVRRRKAGLRRSSAQCGDHVLVPLVSGSGRACERCKLITRTPTSFRTLASRPCKGEVLLGTHPSHRLRASVGVTWCESCGCYMTRLPRALRQPCARAPRSAAARNVLRRLRSGLPPTTAHYLQRAAADDDWLVGAETLLDTTASGNASQRALPEEEGPPVQHPPPPHGAPRPVRRQRARPLRSDRAAGSQTTRQTADGTLEKEINPAVAQSERPIWHRDEIHADGLSHPPRPSRPHSLAPPLRPRAESHAGRSVPELAAAASSRARSSHAAQRGSQAARVAVSAEAGGGTSSHEDAGTSIGAELNVYPPTNPVVNSSEGVSAVCRPTRCQAWTSRIAINSTLIRSNCNICDGVARSRCKGCHHAICMPCARDRRACQPRPAFASVDGHACQDQMRNDVVHVSSHPRGGAAAASRARSSRSIVSDNRIVQSQGQVDADRGLHDQHISASEVVSGSVPSEPCSVPSSTTTMSAVAALAPTCLPRSVSPALAVAAAGDVDGCDQLGTCRAV